MSLNTYSRRLSGMQGVYGAKLLTPFDRGDRRAFYAELLTSHGGRVK